VEANSTGRQGSRRAVAPGGGGGGLVFLPKNHCSISSK
jgi:hypothetical protein